MFSASQVRLKNEIDTGISITYNIINGTFYSCRYNDVLSAVQSKNGKSFELISKIDRGLFEFAISDPL